MESRIKGFFRGVKMETEGTVGKYREGLLEQVVRAARAEGVWQAVERYGVPYSTVKYWCARARKLAEGVAPTAEVGKGPGEGAGTGTGAPAPMQAAPIPVDAVGVVEAVDTVTVGDAAAVLGDGDGDSGQPIAGADARRMWRVHSWEEVVTAVRDSEELGTAGTAKKYGVCEQTVRNWRQQVQEARAECAAQTEPPAETVGVQAPGATGVAVAVVATDFEAAEDHAEAEEVAGRRLTVSVCGAGTCPL